MIAERSQERKRCVDLHLSKPFAWVPHTEYVTRSDRFLCHQPCNAQVREVFRPKKKTIAAMEIMITDHQAINSCLAPLQGPSVQAAAHVLPFYINFDR
jgi:hypothetical protein